MNSANKVAEIFESAGICFSRLGSMAKELQSQDTTHQQGKSEVVKWGKEEIEMLRNAVLQFSIDIDKICEHMKTKSVAQIRTALKRKAVQQKADSNARGGANSATSGVASGQGLLENTLQTPRTSKDDQDGQAAAKRLKMDEMKNAGASGILDNPVLGKSGQMNNSSIIESALDKLRYESKDSHEIDIEG